jgi:hypothetical protein
MPAHDIRARRFEAPRKARTKPVNGVRNNCTSPSNPPAVNPNASSPATVKAVPMARATTSIQKRFRAIVLTEPLVFIRTSVHGTDAVSVGLDSGSIPAS